MISKEDALYTYEYKDYFKIIPSIYKNETTDLIGSGKKVKEGYTYSSDANEDWYSTNDLKKWIDNNKENLEMG